MRIRLFLFLLLMVSGCDWIDNPSSIRLIRKESISYTGSVMHTAYVYDTQERIVSILQYLDYEYPKVLVSITYEGNDAILLSHPELDPDYNQSTKVVLTLDSRGLTQKRTEYTHRVSAFTFSKAETFIYDTLTFEYDALGLLSKTSGTRYDSSWFEPSRNKVRKTSHNGTYKVDSGNQMAFDEIIDYSILSREGETVIHSGGSSAYQLVYSYAKSYPNKTDFRNSAILNEYKEHFDVFSNGNYKHLPDQVTVTSTERDIDGIVFHNGTSTKEIKRGYNNDGLLSYIKIPENTQYTEVHYFYR